MKPKIPISVAGSLLAVAFSAASAASQEQLRFQVFLDDKPIGEHSFEIQHEPGQQRVASRAEFDVNILFFSAYRYRHASNEVFRNGCLQRISATTNDNGTQYRVVGSSTGEAFRIDRGDTIEQADGCLKTFAYWDPAILEQDRLLNPQTGKLESVEVRRRGTEQVEVDDGKVSATRYALATGELTIDLWYSDALGWVRLASDTGKGARLIYRRL